jgi:iron complex outermembrane receptor protein
MKRFALGCAAMLHVLLMQAQVVLSGHVHDASTGQAIPGVVVSTQGLKHTSVTDADGMYKLQLAEGRHLLVMQHLAYHTDSLVIDLTEDRHIDRELRPKNIALQAVWVQSERSLRSPSDAAPVEALERRMTDGVNYHLGALLNGVSGVATVTTGSNAGQPVVRGLFGSRVAVIVNGVPQQTQQWGTDHGSDLDPWMAERVSVVKGPATLRYGPNASGGAVVIEPSPLLKAGGLSVGAFMRGQSVNDGVDGGLRIRKRWGRLQLEALGTLRQYGDLRVPADTFVHLSRYLPLYDERMVNTSGQSDGQQLRLRYIGQKGSHRLELRRTDNRYGLFPGIFGVPSLPALAGDGNPRVTGLPFVTSEHRAVSYHLHRRAGKGELDLSAGWQQNIRTENGPPHAHGNAPLPASTTALDLDLRTLFANLHYEQQLKDERSLFVALQGEHQDSRSAGWEFLVNDYRMTTAGVASGLDGLRFLNGTVGMGVRFDFAATAADAYSENLYDTDQQVIGSQVRSAGVRKPMQTWAANLNWRRKVGVHQYWSVQLSRTSRFPTPFELSANGIHHGTFRHEQGDPDLKPESGYQLDVMWRFDYGNFQLSVSPFYGYYRNFIYLDPSGTFSPLPDAGQIYRFRQDEVLRGGGEADVRWAMHPDVALDWNLETVFSYKVEDGTYLPWTPPVRSDVGIDWSVWQRKRSELNVRPSAVFTAPQNRTDRNEDPTDGYALAAISVMASIPVGQHEMQISAFVHNLFDQRYIDHMSRYKLINLPEAGRNFGFSLRYEFNQTR